MKKPGKTAQESLMEKMKELGQKHGVKVTDLSQRGVRAIGITGGINHGMKMFARTSPRRIGEGAITIVGGLFIVSRI